MVIASWPRDLQHIAILKGILRLISYSVQGLKQRRFKTALNKEM